MARHSSAAYVTAVLRFMQAFNRGDLETCESLLDAEVEWQGASEYRGRAEVRAMLESYAERFASARLRPEDFREANGHVLMVVAFHEGDADAPRKEQRQSWILDLTDDKLLIRRVLCYPSPAEAARALEALADAGPKVHA